ncbi:MAG: 30S ribosomal protein S4 [Cytophagales bacterium]|nr:30S ribosomal protein S4 [Cytophagales bacterium]
MARYRGPRVKISRRFREPVFGPSRALQKKNYPPGEHGRSRRRRSSEYAIQLGEKQKAKYTYGLLERQFSNLFKEASRMSGVTGENLLILLESRLDNVVFRLGIAPTRRSARQMVSHRHILVNGKGVNIPSFTLKEGDVIGIRPASREWQVIHESLNENAEGRPNWLEWNESSFTGRMAAKPTREQIAENIKEQLIVELYSK